MKSPGNTREALRPEDEPIDAVAQAWVKRRAAGMAPSEGQELRAWLAADPRHPAAFSRANTEADEFDWPLHTGTLDAVLGGLEKRAGVRRRRRAVAAAVAAAFAIGTGILWLVSGYSFLSPRMEEGARLSQLLVVQPQRQTLPDGSVVELKAGATIALAFSDKVRGVILKQGEAHFQVAKLPARPFVVRVDGIEVRAVGTAFSVQLGQAAVAVIVTEGRVALDRPVVPPSFSQPSDTSASQPSAARIVEVDAGHRAIISRAPASAGPQVQPVAATDVNEELQWRIPRLEFTGTPLSEVVAMLNRHAASRPGGRRLVVDPELEGLRVSGALRADKTDALLDMLESDFPVRAERQADGTVLLHRKR
jgi:transmembrane sensor